jgi:ribosomal protein L12E/L44/L45/RPP1/RPP2
VIDICCYAVLLIDLLDEIPMAYKRSIVAVAVAVAVADPALPAEEAWGGAAAAGGDEDAEEETPCRLGLAGAGWTGRRLGLP